MADQRYRVIERLEAGGMAEVFIGEAQSVQGFKKRVAIKRVLPHLAQNKKFITMFLDEARLGARLNHANIVTVFDIGAADNTYFIVMEYVDGANLKNIIEAIRKQGRSFPMKEAIYLCMEAARGLSYAHELTDDDGNALHIVHRDVSPPNLMLSRRGEVKVTDFGLAKATTQLEKTDPGVVKGKFSYLSPEQASGREADARSDVFAMGIVLWEMLAGRRLFLGETDYQTVKLVQQANVPSLRRLNPDVDEAFEAVLGRALAKDPAQRFQSAREYGDALAGYLFEHQMKVTSYDIANLVTGVVQESDRAKRPQQRGQSIIDRLIQEELLSFTSIEELSDPAAPGATPLSPDEVEGQHEHEAGALENPADWFNDDSEVTLAVPERSKSNRPQWNEAGIEALPKRERERLRAPPAPPVPDIAPSDTDPMADAAPEPELYAQQAHDGEASPASVADDSEPYDDRSIPPQSLRPVAVGERQVHAAALVDAPPEAKRGGGWKWIVLVLIVLAAGGAAAAWFAGLIPH